MVRWLMMAAIVGLAGCASLVGSRETVVRIDTQPSQAHCDLTGWDGWKTAITTPANVTVPNSAAPVSVTCSAPGRRTTSYTLDATSDGWRWGNSALVVVTGGAAILGLMVDESRDAGKSYTDSVTYQLDDGRPRPVHVRDRNGAGMELQAR
jgi:hypothetical protein